jgi:hypothetical protein
VDGSGGASVRDVAGTEAAVSAPGAAVDDAGAGGAVGLAPATVNAVELGVRVPSVIVLLRLAAGLQVPWVALMEPAHEEAERLVREAWVMPVPEVSPAVPVRSGPDQAEGPPAVDRVGEQR